ncbi:phage holin family protein [Ligilactobacillus equi]|uniref:Holin, phage phi LC3 family n=1 Tax=Ligilactobacillus equi DPC 6820 TaxID=1392007 RepID=V7HWY3_9LACO|nr:phage holin family protein [Ligilactobacillus equi]ETA74377.1 holin, phage phi LC3 family [Ligilactobacillus equi DPC 6820]
MMNLKVRMKNPVFVVQLILSILTPILGYAGISAQELTSWKTLGTVLMEAIGNPYVLSLVAVSLCNALNDPTTKGLGDSIQALNYDKPKGGKR